jgi:hypothetical protein
MYEFFISDNAIQHGMYTVKLTVWGGEVYDGHGDGDGDGDGGGDDDDDDDDVFVVLLN